ncbi:site-2 protease family protein [Legionella londiniensis]|uniref:Zinc metalloprotease n=1 Tax=Legionella londiniensis TaxID=45068 RepID=A0A0W0VP46_9GAMM|nr:site-2 protease family protein [Legionella londiniensis]KTD21725.1 putative zinc metalloprotease Rip3 [Legionella londiniensis]STX93438.1 inosine 5'-monophosphate dehydrogenase [Legionella londiniensis]
MDKKKPSAEAGIHLFKMLGFEVRMDWSWLFLALLVTWTLAVGYFPAQLPDLQASTYWLMGLLGTLGLFFSIILHELCHSLVGRAYGIPMDGITLFIFGGIAHMRDMPSSPKSEFLMAVVGPLFSLGLAAFFFSLIQIGEELNWYQPLLAVITYLAAVNLVVGMFNLLPGFPLDGGRVFRSILWWWKGDLIWATNIACKGGVVLGYSLIIFGIMHFFLGALISGVWLFLLGFFIERLSRSSYEQVLIKQIFNNETIEKYAKTNPVTVTEPLTLAELMNNYFYRYYHKLYPVVQDDKLTGYISLKEIKEINQDNWRTITVGEVMQRCPSDIVIEADTTVIQALQMMYAQNISRMIVTKNGRLYGILTLKDMMNVVSIRMTLEQT